MISATASDDASLVSKALGVDHETGAEAAETEPRGIDPIDVTGPEDHIGPDTDEQEPVASAVGVAPPSRRSTRTEHDREQARALFAELVDPATEPERRRRVRDELAETHLPLVEYLARGSPGVASRWTT